MTTSEIETIRLTAQCFVWSIPLDRVKWRLTNQDILDALSVFKEKTGQVATTILLHPLTQKYGLTSPDGVVVQYSFSVLAHEVFFPVAEQPPKCPDPPPDHKIVVAKIADKPQTINRIMQQPKKEENSPVLPTIPVSKRGRPLKSGEVHRVTVWRRRKKEKQVVML